MAHAFHEKGGLSWVPETRDAKLRRSVSHAVEKGGFICRQQQVNPSCDGKFCYLRPGIRWNQDEPITIP